MNVIECIYFVILRASPVFRKSEVNAAPRLTANAIPCKLDFIQGLLPLHFWNIEPMRNRTRIAITLPIALLALSVIGNWTAAQETERKLFTPEVEGATPLLDAFSESRQEFTTALRLNRMTGDGTLWAVRQLPGGRHDLAFFRQGKWQTVQSDVGSIPDFPYRAESFKVMIPGAGNHMLLGPSISRMILFNGTEVLASGTITKMVERHTEHFCKAFGPGTPFLASRVQPSHAAICANDKQVWVISGGLPCVLHIFADGAWYETRDAIDGSMLLWPGPNHKYVCEIDPFHDNGGCHLLSVIDGEFNHQRVARPRYFERSKFVREGNEATWTRPAQHYARRLDKNGVLTDFRREGEMMYCDSKGRLWFNRRFTDFEQNEIAFKKVVSSKGETDDGSSSGSQTLETIDTFTLPCLRIDDVIQLGSRFWVKVIFQEGEDASWRRGYPGVISFTLNEENEPQDVKAYTLPVVRSDRYRSNGYLEISPQGFACLHIPGRDNYNSQTKTLIELSR